MYFRKLLKFSLNSNHLKVIDKSNIGIICYNRNQIMAFCLNVYTQCNHAKNSEKEITPFPSLSSARRAASVVLGS